MFEISGRLKPESKCAFCSPNTPGAAFLDTNLTQEYETRISKQSMVEVRLRETAWVVERVHRRNIKHRR